MSLSDPVLVMYLPTFAWILQPVSCQTNGAIKANLLLKVQSAEQISEPGRQVQLQQRSIIHNLN